MISKKPTHAGVELIFVSVILTLGAYLYLSHLSGAVPGYSDENRVFHLNPFSPLLYFICRPFRYWMQSQDAPYYLMGGLGLFNILLLYIVTKLYFDSTKAIISTCFYLLYDVPLAYAKQLYYSTPIITLLLLCMLSIHLSHRYKSLSLGLVTGLLSGAMILINGSSYACIGIIIVLAFFMNRLKLQNHTHRPEWLYYIFIISGIFISFVLFEFYLWHFTSHQPNLSYSPYWKSLVGYQEVTQEYLRGLTGIQYVSKFFSEIATRSFGSLLHIARNGIILILVLIGLRSIISNKDKKSFYIHASYVMGFFFLLLFVSLGKHVIQLRHVTWLAIIISWLVADSILLLMKHQINIFKKITAAVLCAYLILASQHALAITHSMFSMNPIWSYLKENNIPLNKTMTMFYSVQSFKNYQNGEFALAVPFIQTHRAEDNEKDLYVFINWASVKQAYKKGKVRYYLSSSIGHIANADVYDPFLKYVEPMQVWDAHPLRNKWVYWKHHDYNIKLYDVGQILKVFDYTKSKFKDA